MKKWFGPKIVLDHEVKSTAWRGRCGVVQQQRQRQAAVEKKKKKRKGKGG